VSNPTARRYHERENRRAEIIAAAKIALALILACVFFAAPCMSWPHG